LDLTALRWPRLTPVGLFYTLAGAEFHRVMLLHIASIAGYESPPSVMGVARLAESIMMGAALGLLALLPRALSTPERAPALNPAAEPVEPADASVVAPPARVA
jgi:hypothetical protein